MEFSEQPLLIGYPASLQKVPSFCWLDRGTANLVRHTMGESAHLPVSAAQSRILSRLGLFAPPFVVTSLVVPFLPTLTLIVVVGLRCLIHSLSTSATDGAHRRVADAISGLDVPAPWRD